MKSLLALAFLAAALTVGAAGSSAAVGSVPSFAASKRYLVPISRGCGYCAYSVAIGDLNGDGRPDVVTVNEETISIFVTKPDGTFRARRDYLGAGEPWGAVIADLNGDGHADVAVVDLDGFVSVFLNRGDGTLAARRDYRAGTTGPVSIAAADLDGDGKPDLVTANGEDGTVSVLLNKGDGTFAAKTDYPIGGGNPVSVALGDLDGDGKPDIVTADELTSDGGVSVLVNRGDGTFQSERTYDDPQGALSVALGDLNGDGKLDVATADGGPGWAGAGVSVLVNTGDGTLVRTRTYGILSGLHGFDSPGDPRSVAIADLNGDRRPDLVTANFDRHVSLLLNGGGGAFHLPIDLGAAKCGGVGVDQDRGLAIGDLNGDGRADLAVAGINGLCVSLARPGLCNVQDVRGLKVGAARTLLARAHCGVGAIRYSHSGVYKRGQVSTQRPGFGSALRAGARIDLVLSRGPKR